MLSLILAAQVVVLTQGGSIYQPGPRFGGNFQDADTMLHLDEGVAGVTGVFPRREFEHGNVTLQFKAEDGIRDHSR